MSRSIPDLPATMRVAEISAPGGPEVLRATTAPVPEPASDEILIRVAYAGVNRPDALQRAGSYAPPPGASPLPGLEASGEVGALGAGVSWAKSGLSLNTTCRLISG